MNQTETLTRGADLLTKHFCNCLRLGQWELAKACGRLLYDSESCKQVEEILLDIGTQSINRRYVIS